MINNENLRLVNNGMGKRFLGQAESGMGYQIVYDDGDQKNVKLILNSEYSIEVNQLYEPVDFNGQFRERRFPFNQPLAFSFEKINKTDLIRDQINPNAKVALNFVPAAKIPMTSLPPFSYFSRRGDEFYRLTSFRKDKRVTSSGMLTPGTYGTTINDMKVVTSGASAVGRYALPSRIPATYLFKIIPDPGTPIFFGTVIPNFGLAGGGVEAYFPNGTAKGTVQLMGTIPEF